MQSIEFCAGAGGQAIGLEQAGFHHSALVEIEPDFAKTLRLNRPQWDVRTADMRAGSVCLHKDWQRISGSSAGCFLEMPIWVVMQGGRSPTGMTTHIGGQIHAATFTGRLSKYD